MALLEQTVQEHPDRAQAHLVLGLLHAREGRYPAAIVAYQRAIAAVPSYGEAWFNLGESYLKQNDYAAAEQAFSSAVAADTTSAQFRNGLGRSYYLRRDYAAAVAEFSRAVRLDSLFCPSPLQPRQRLAAFPVRRKRGDASLRCTSGSTKRKSGSPY